MHNLAIQGGKNVAQTGRMVRALYLAAIIATSALGILHLSRLIDLIGPTSWIPLLAGLLVGAMAADLVTGLVHWGCDTWGDEETPWIGSSLIRWFRAHHREPRAMLEHDWIEVNGAPAVAASAAFLLLPTLGSLSVFGYATAWSLIAAGALANQLHQWAHMGRPPRLIRGLQRSGLILSRIRHARHHARHTGGYCISTGWLNGLLDATGFWRALERSIAFVTGAEPRADARNRS
jgi:ubiquitin-conjugating enzyme E2 variant